jgi:glycosyltransferase involved in cell wall biosynthesis
MVREQGGEVQDQKKSSGGKFRTRPMLPPLPRLHAEFAACTIIAKNYLPMARLLAESFQRHNPACPFFVLLMDPVEGCFQPEPEPFHLLETRQLAIRNLEGLLFKYNILEASTAVKPTLLAKLFADHDIQKLLYLDPDILILNPLTDLSHLLDEHSIVLTPHITSPYPDGAKPGDHDILQAGSFNLGFLGLRNTPTTQELLAWWQRKLYHHGLLAFDRNMFVDQRWMDLAPGLFRDVKILRDSRYNVAYWNLHERRVEVRDDRVLVNGSPCYFFHFSGFNPEEPSVVSKHQNRFTMADLGDGKSLFTRYRKLVLAKGWKQTKNWLYTYDYFDNGVRIPESARRYYWSLGEDVEQLGDPFAWLNEREPTGVVDIKDRPFGINVVGYVASEKGVGEAARSNLRIVKAAGIPYVANNFADSGSLNLENPPENSSREHPYGINLVNVNADQAPYFAERNPGYLSGRYNVGYWAWELSSFPREWCGSFTYFDEVWVPSMFVRQSVSAASPIPVTCIPHSIDPELRPSAEWNRQSFGLSSEVFVYLFFFDFHSFLERKNPLGIIKAFKAAFGGRKDVLLLIKSIHAASQPGELRLLQRESRGANIRIFDCVLSRQGAHDLMSVADCYVSLHRSEGFGLTLAEAMRCCKPVIATGYSGNMDFMNQENSFLVPYCLVEIEKDHGPYKKGCAWADPDLHRAAQFMQRVYEDRSAASKVATRGRDDVMTSLHPRTIGDLVKKRLTSLNLVPADLCTVD